MIYNGWHREEADNTVSDCLCSLDELVTLGYLLFIT